MRKIVGTIPGVLMVSAALGVLLTYAGDFIDEEPFQTESSIVEEVEVEHEAEVEMSSQFSGEEKIGDEIFSGVEIGDDSGSIDNIGIDENFGNNNVPIVINDVGSNKSGIVDNPTGLEELNVGDAVGSNVSDGGYSVVSNDLNSNPFTSLEESHDDLTVKGQDSQQIVSDLDVYMIENQDTIHHFTLMDRNLGATEVYNNDYSNPNVNSLGSYYQWGNNYGFDSKAVNEGILNNITGTTVDASSYSWDNPYESHWFVKGTNWMKSKNSNLWGGDEDEVSHKQGPCPQGYHVPSVDEWRGVVTSYSSTKNGGMMLSRYLLMPAAGYRDRGYSESVLGTINGNGNYVYASSSLNSNNISGRIVYVLVRKGDGDLAVSNGTDTYVHEWSSNGISVRCLKNVVNTGIEAIDDSDIHLNGGKKAIISLLSSGEVKLLQNPTRDSGTFGGRYTGEDFLGEQIVVGSLLLSGSSLYAKWDCPEGEVDNGERCVKVYPYVITFDANSGIVSQSNMSVIYGSTENLPIPIRTGYIFKGWYSNHDGSSNNYINYGDYYKFTSKVSIHLSAYMENRNTYASWWNNNSKYKMISCTQQGGWSIESTQDGYIRFSNYDKGKGYKNAISEMMWSDLSSGWHDFDIVFDGEYTYGYLDGELIAQSERYVSGKIGYNANNSIFLGAEADSNSTIPESRYFIGRIKNVMLENSDELITSGVAFNKFSMPNQDVTLYAEWEPEVYNIVYTGIDDAVFENENPLTYTAESGFTLNNPTRDHYNFIGWSGTDIDGTSDVVAIITGSRGNRVYEAVWEPVKYTITWIDGDGNELKNEQVAYDTLPIYIGDIPTKTPTAKTGYTFNNIWIPTPYAVTGNETYRAQFSEYINKYVIKFYDGSGNLIESGEYEYGTVSGVYKPVDPEKEGYTFIRWEPDLITVVTGATYNAVFSINQYELTLEKGVGVAELSGGGVYDYNTQYIYTGIALTGYHFEGGEAIKEFTGLVPAHDVNIVVEAIPNTYYVRFNKNGGVGNMENQSFIYNQSQALSVNKFTRSGYYFGGWSDRNGGIYEDKEVVLNLIPEGIIDFWVQWVKGVTPDPEPGPTPTPESGSSAAGGGRIIQKEEIQEHDSAEINTGTTVNTGTAAITGMIENVMTGTQLMTGTTINTGINETFVPVIENRWTQEEIDAYEYAYKYGITTLAPRDMAMPDGNLQRGHMAKMVVNYAIHVLGWTLPETIPKQCKWKDGANAWESQEIKDYAQKACALGLMGIDMDYFQPYKLVTRAQFGTIIGRFLWGKLSSKPYYAEHLLRLKERGIMTQIDNPENRIEVRKWAWLMFMRMENYIGK